MYPQGGIQKFCDSILVLNYCLSYDFFSSLTAFPSVSAFLHLSSY